mmetsp:Transcript_9635/g.27809  ORF Transcript_9635/g.27809 Transcript_9635/m.27809 type:complete len:201 (+) Transcript_9635:532-1134(+)
MKAANSSVALSPHTTAVVLHHPHSGEQLFHTYASRLPLHVGPIWEVSFPSRSVSCCWAVRVMISSGLMRLERLLMPSIPLKITWRQKSVKDAAVSLDDAASSLSYMTGGSDVWTAGRSPGNMSGVRTRLNASVSAWRSRALILLLKIDGVPASSARERNSESCRIAAGWESNSILVPTWRTSSGVMMTGREGRWPQFFSK